ncbi:PREDICTED: RNA polymerase II-associated factor 1 homolog [Amphimedon queenslandica]|uniref:RNA polymerase II-associated factor 1 homolog n=1 Tax=Amphimedon queenslandica TaxID=400682 RepID=A0A1X7VBR6_AMPQE|nr:PREDICTED: RNA polymerase II-associated factor 1 homolog [Amphimedon queenslandica]|eukprot:XP_011402726.1 PREDICTED: RNA polymerase II-associated factor 1 homolog [Amphimedon queenslandica]
MPTVDKSRGVEKRSSLHKVTPNVVSRNDLLCSVQFKNVLPDVPFEPKFITYPFDSLRFIQYNPTSLERNHRHETLTEVDLGVSVDLILHETHTSLEPADSELHPDDKILLEEEVTAQPESKRARQHARNVSWLRRTEYISSELTRSHTVGETAETKVGYNVKKKLQGLNLYKDRDSQISAIESTFTAAQKPILKHYSKPGVEAREVLPLFPDFKLWHLPFAQVIFDTDPAVYGKKEDRQMQEMSQAMIRGMMDENNEQFVAYFLPSPDTITKREEDDRDGISFRPDEEYEYSLSRDYNWNVKNKASKGYEESYFFVVRPGEGVYYNEIETRVRLNKRRMKTKSAMNSKLLVRHREMTQEEKYAQTVRLTQLEPAVALEEEEEEEEEGEGEETRTSEEEEEAEEEGEEGGSDKDDEFEKAFSSGEDD